MNQEHSIPIILGTLKKYLQFCLVGGSGMFVDMLVLGLLASPACLGWNLTFSKIIAAETAIFNNFFWNDLWTFRGSDPDQNHVPQRLLRFAKFNLICLTGIGWSVLLLNLQVHVFHWNLYGRPDGSPHL